MRTESNFCPNLLIHKQDDVCDSVCPKERDNNTMQA